MKKILLAMTALSAMAVAAPASAQYANSNIGLQIEQLQLRLQTSVRNGTISRQEAMSLRQQLRSLTRLERQYSRDGLSRGEREDLRQRMQSLRQQVRLAERGSNGRWDRDGRDCPPGLEKRNNGCTPPGQVGRDRDDDRWENRDRDDDRWENRDRDNDRWENRDRDDDRWDDGDRRDDDRNRGGLLDRVIDGVTGRGGLRVGQRASADLGAVPYEYRNQYRDGGGVYYRADARSIYQIDARSHIVLRVYSRAR